MIGRDLNKIQGKVGLRSDEFPVMDGPGNGTDVRFFLSIRDDHDLLNGRKVLDDIRNSADGIKGLSIVGVPIGGKQDLRFDLTEPVQDPLDAEIREQEDQTAPREVAASIAMMVSIILGMKPTTRSPGLTPIPLRDLARAAT